MKKNVLFREALREIRHSKNRFFSILAIVAIGSGFFSGVKAACPDMKLTAEQYFTESSLADLHLVSTWGFDEDDLAQIGSDQDIRVMEPCYTYDVLAESADGDQLDGHAAARGPVPSPGRVSGRRSSPHAGSGDAGVAGRGTGRGVCEPVSRV